MKRIWWRKREEENAYKGWWKSGLCISSSNSREDTKKWKDGHNAHVHKSKFKRNFCIEKELWMEELRCWRSFLSIDSDAQRSNVAEYRRHSMGMNSLAFRVNGFVGLCVFILNKIQMLKSRRKKKKLVKKCTLHRMMKANKHYTLFQLLTRIWRDAGGNKILCEIKWTHGMACIQYSLYSLIHGGTHYEIQ